MSGFEERGERIGERGAAELCARLKATARDEVPGDVSVERQGLSVVLSGRRLRARALGDARLRGLGMLLKGSGR